MMGKRGEAFAYGAVTVLLLGATVAISGRTLPGAEVGDVDPAGAVVGLTALAVSVWTGWLTVRSLRWQETVLADVAERLAVEVLAAERTARRQLLGDHDKTINVQFAFLPAPTHNVDGAGVEGELERVADYYRSLRPRRLVITGAPGAGKTVLAMQLMLRLLETRAPEDPVPVRLSLASWNTDWPLEEWISRHLIDTYRVPAAAAEELLKARWVLPVLDGLDEMDIDPDPGYASRAGRAVRALNAYQQATGKAAVVMTCRSQAHEALEALGVWAHDAARVEIHPVDAGAVQRFLAVRVDNPARWNQVRDALAQDSHGPLAVGLSTPWRLTLAVTVYEERRSDGTYRHDLRNLFDPALATPEAIGEYLLGLFIPAATARHSISQRSVYTADDVYAWLTVLAGYLAQNANSDRQVGGRQLSSSDIVLHELWPLAGVRLPRAVHAALMGLVTLIFLPLYIFLLSIDFPLRLGLLAGVVPLITGLTVLGVWKVHWPQPVRLDLGRVRTPAGRRRLMGYVAFGLVLGSVVGLLSAQSAGLVFGLMGVLASGLATALVTGLTAPGVRGIADPRGVIRHDFTAWLMFLGAIYLAATAFGLMFGVTIGVLSGATLSGVVTLVCVYADGLAASRTTGFRSQFATMRYVAFLLCTRRWNGQPLPWRLGRFLHWCYGARILRVAGVGYQFRHRELQDYLARHVSCDPAAGTGEPS